MEISPRQMQYVYLLISFMEASLRELLHFNCSGLPQCKHQLLTTVLPPTSSQTLHFQNHTLSYMYRSIKYIWVVSLLFQELYAVA